MPLRPPNINCQCYQLGTGKCLHAAAPRKLFGLVGCVLVSKPTDPRTPEGCRLQYEFKRPDGVPNPPPARMIREGSGVTRFLPPNTVK